MDASARGLAATALKQGRVLAQSAVAVPHTGDTTEAVLASVTVPAGLMGPNGRVEIFAHWSCSNNANNKTFAVKFGGASYLAAVQTATASVRVDVYVANRNANNSQVGHGNTLNSFGATANAKVTSAVDTGADVIVQITGTLANAGDTITLESYIVSVWPRS